MTRRNTILAAVAVAFVYAVLWADAAPPPVVPPQSETDQVVSVVRASDGKSAPFNLIAGSYPNGQGKQDNFVLFAGHNVVAGGGPGDYTKPMMCLSAEQNFNNNGVWGSEFHLIHKPTYAGSAVNRPLSFFLANDRKPAQPWHYGAVFDVAGLSHEGGGKPQFTSSTTDGFVAYQGLQIQHLAPKRNALTITAGANQTARLFSIQKAGKEQLRVGPEGGLSLYGADGKPTFEVGPTGKLTYGGPRVPAGIPIYDAAGKQSGVIPVVWRNP